MSQNSNVWRHSRVVSGLPAGFVNTVCIHNTHRYTREFQPYPGCLCRRFANRVPPRSRLPQHRVAVAGDVFPTVADVHMYAPHEIVVKIMGPNEIVVEGRHEDRRFPHGFVARYFRQRIIVPETHDAEGAIGRITAQGNMSLWVPRRVRVHTETETETESESEPEVRDVRPFQPIALPNAENYQQWRQERH